MRLILIRHCKSDWSTGVDDHDRPLNRRGSDAAVKLGQWMKGMGLQPDLWLVSTALRTQATAVGIRDAAGDTSEMRTDASLYHPMPGGIIDMVKATGQDCVVVVSHNPGIGRAADLLAAAPPDHSRFQDYPTGATTVLDFNGGVAEGAGHVAHFVIPGEL